MSAPTAVADGAPAPVKSGKKKLILIVAVLALLLAGGGGAAVFMMKKKAAAEAAAEDEDDEASKHTAKVDLKNAPTFVTLEPFTVNLADRDAERYAQVGMTLELADPKAGDLLKAYMPAIRNNILLALAAKTAGQLMEHEGKLRLAAEVRAAALKPLGYAVEPGHDESGEDGEDEGATKAKSKGKAKAKKAKAAESAAPIRAVHFSNFIIQ